MWEDLAPLEGFIFVPQKTDDYRKNVEEGRIKYTDKEDPKYSLYQAIDLYIQKYNEQLSELSGKFVKYLFNNTYVVYISTESLPYAIQLFNVLNTRGLPLTPADILKAVNLGEIDEKKREDLAKKWRNIENNIGREEVGKVIEFIRTLKLKSKARAGIYEEYDELIFKPKLGGEPLIKKGEEFIDYLEKISDIYRSLVLETDDLKTESKYKNLVNLMKDYIPFDDWIAPLIAFHEKFYHYQGLGKSINNYLPAFLSILEKKTVTEWVVGFTATKRIESLNDVIKLIEKAVTPEEVLGIDNLKIKENKKSDFESKISGKDFYYENFAKYLLLRLDLEMWEQENFQGYRGLITIEHVLPQEPLENSEWVKNFDKKQREEGQIKSVISYC